MPAQKLRKFLDENRIRYATIAHSPAYTAQEIAQTAHISGREVAKTVIAEADGRLVMAVVPATHKVDTALLQKAIGADTLKVVHEKDFRDAFPGCELGAMPPFGNLWDMPVYVDEMLAEDEAIAFNAGSHTELMQMRFDDFERLVKPKIVAMAGAAVG